MARRPNLRRLWAVLALLASLGVVIPGCSTTDDAENLSERPWNAPKSWEGGMPSGMFEGR
jgi:hypothetical protein